MHDHPIHLLVQTRLIKRKDLSAFFEIFLTNLKEKEHYYIINYILNRLSYFGVYK